MADQSAGVLLLAPARRHSIATAERRSAASRSISSAPTHSSALNKRGGGVRAASHFNCILRPVRRSASNNSTQGQQFSGCVGMATTAPTISALSRAAPTTLIAHERAAKARRLDPGDGSFPPRRHVHLPLLSSQERYKLSYDGGRSTVTAGGRLPRCLARAGMFA